MAWFGETFGDGLNSLKGQITKITKDVLSDDPLGSTSYEGRIKELERTCEESKSEIEQLKTENRILRESRGFELTEDQIQNLCQLENELREVIAERDSLNKSLEELDVEHQKELDFIISDRDSLKNLLCKYENSTTSENGDRTSGESELSQLELENSSLVDNSKDTDHEIRELTQESHRLTDELHALQTDRNKLDSELRDNYYTLEQVYLQLKSDTLSEPLEFREICDELKNVFSYQTNELKKKDLEISNLSEEINGLKKELLDAKELQNLKDDELLRCKSDFECKFHDLESKLSESSRTAEECASRASENQSKSEEINFFKQELERRISDLVEERSQLKEKLEKLENTIYEDNETTIGDFENLQLENVELNRKISELKAAAAQNSTTIDNLRDDNARLHEKLQSAADEMTAKDVQYKLSVEMCNNLSFENRTMREELDKLQEDASGKQLVSNEWLGSLIDQLRLIHVNLGSTGHSDAVLSLQIANERVSQILAEQQERSNCVNNTFSHEIDKLKGLLTRIRREFVHIDQGGSRRHDQPDVDSLLSQSQTDDVKRLQQDVAQMTEIIELIFHELTITFNDIRGVDKKFNDLRTMFLETEKELTNLRREKDQLIIEMEKYVKKYEEKEQELQQYIQMKTTLEEEKNALAAERNDLSSRLNSMQQSYNNLEMDMTILQERLKELEQSPEKDNTIEMKELSSLTSERAQQIQELNSINEEKSKLLADNQALQTELDKLLEREKEWKAINTNLDSNIQRLVARNEDLEKREENQTDMKNVLSTDLAKEKTRGEELKDVVNRLQDENSDLKSLIQQLRENIVAMNAKEEENSCATENETVELLRSELQQEQSRYRQLLAQQEVLTEKNSSLQRDVQRLREHLVEIQDHYTTEAVETERSLCEYKTKLAAAEDQLRNSSTVYKSANVRSTQHVEALQSQIKLITVQRDDLRVKLSAAEDMVQKHLTAQESLQMVLEQFQLDKGRELQTIATKHDYQLHLARKRAEELESEISALNDQLTEAKNGLKAASRLGEQLDIKSEKIKDLEEQLSNRQSEILEMDRKLAAINQTTSGKIDKFLVKNLVIGFLSSSQGDRKTQALKILASVLELNEEEKNRIGLDGQGGWFSNLIHPRSEPTGESLSHAFIRFLENESRPQPQLRLLPEAGGERISTSAKKNLVLTDLVLPSVTPTQVSESSESVLKDVLKDS